MNITVKPPERLDDDDEGEIVMISEWHTLTSGASSYILINITKKTFRYI